MGPAYPRVGAGASNRYDRAMLARRLLGLGLLAAAFGGAGAAAGGGAATRPAGVAGARRSAVVAHRPLVVAARRALAEVGPLEATLGPFGAIGGGARPVVAAVGGGLIGARLAAGERRARS